MLTIIMLKNKTKLNVNNYTKFVIKVVIKINKREKKIQST